jgi:hypothetical protein
MQHWNQTAGQSKSVQPSVFYRLHCTYQSPRELLVKRAHIRFDAVIAKCIAAFVQESNQCRLIGYLFKHKKNSGNRARMQEIRNMKHTRDPNKD